jgi:cysteinylglycine-S-conjugate dipeptidase
MMESDIEGLFEGMVREVVRWTSILAELCRFRTSSREPAPSADMRASADRIARLLSEVGLEHVQVVSPPGAHPSIRADWLHASGQPTVLLYSHHDVQPEGRLQDWESPPYALTGRNGRLYARGVADDKGAIVAQLLAIEALLRQRGHLPVNVRILIDGEEEISSPSLGALLKNDAQADVVVVNDTESYAVGHPSITYALRGLVACRLEIHAIDRPLHSGGFGGPTPDPSLSLVQILSRLADHNGTSLVNRGEIRGVSEATRRRLEALPMAEDRFRKLAGIIEGVPIAGPRSASILEKLWFQPAVSINAIDTHALEGSSNQLVPVARARVSLRTVPEMHQERTLSTLVHVLATDPPQGVKVAAVPEPGTDWWCVEPEGPAFEAAKRALLAGYGHEPVLMGCGGSIPVVPALARLNPSATLLLLGLADSRAGAHAENESIDADDLWKCSRALAALLSDLAI